MPHPIPPAPCVSHTPSVSTFDPEWVWWLYRRLQIEDLEARIALMPLFQAERDRR